MMSRTRIDVKIMVQGNQFVLGKKTAIVRKTEIDDEDRCAGVFGLSHKGEWIEIPEGKPYPLECWLDTIICEVSNNFDLEGNWTPKLQWKEPRGPEANIRTELVYCEDLDQSQEW